MRRKKPVYCAVLAGRTQQLQIRNAIGDAFRATKRHNNRGYEALRVFGLDEIAGLQKPVVSRICIIAAEGWYESRLQIIERAVFQVKASALSESYVNIE
jgi:hypothetical protein